MAERAEAINYVRLDKLGVVQYLTMTNRVVIPSAHISLSSLN